MLQQLQSLEQQAAQELSAEISNQKNLSSIQAQYSVDLRYKGQSFSLSLAWSDFDSMAANFHQLHRKRYGHEMEIDVELVTLRVSVTTEAPPFALPELNEESSPSLTPPTDEISIYGIDESVKVYQRENLVRDQSVCGPALIVEKVSTTFIDENWVGKVDRFGSIVLKKH